MKKKIVIVILLFCVACNLFAFDVASLVTGDDLFDVMFLQMLVRFYQTKFMFIKIMQTTAVGFAVIGAFWWVMKILLMGESTEKALVDILTKIILYVVLVMMYPKLVDGVLGLSTNIGMRTGLDTINEKIIEMSKTILAEINAAKLANSKKLLDFFDELEKNKADNAQFNMWETYSRGPMEVDRQDIKTAATQFGISEAEVQGIITSAGYTLVWPNSDGTKSKSTLAQEIQKYNKETAQLYTQLKNIQKDPNTGEYNTQAFSSLIKNFIGTDANNEQYYHKAEITFGAMMAAKRDGMSAAKYTTGSWSDMKARLIAIVRVCMTETEQENLEKYIDRSEHTFTPMKIDTMLRLQPFIPLNGKTVNNVQGDSSGVLGGGDLILSPSAMMKISLLTASLAKTSMEESTKEKNKPKKLADFIFENLFNFVALIIIIFGIIICGCYLCIQYIMMICEYYLVSAICYILLPLLMWEVTASYTKNLIKLYISYFFKMMVMLLVVMWAYGSYLDLAMFINSVGYSNVLSVILNTIFTLLITMSFVGEAPKIAQVILTGNPDMSMGEFVKQAMFAGRVAKAGINLGKKTVKTGAKIAAGTASAVAGVAGMAAGAGSAGAAKAGEVKAAKGMQAKAAGEHSAALENQKSAIAKESAASGKLSGAQSNLGSAEQKSEGAKGKLDSAKSKLASAEQKFAQAKGKKNKQKAKQDVNSAKNDVVLAQSEYDNAEQERHQRQDEYNTAQTEYQEANNELLDANSEVQRTSEFLNASNAAVKRAKKLNGAGSYVGNAIGRKISNSTVRMLKLDQGTTEYKNGQWQNKTTSSKSGMAGYMQYQRDKARAMFDEQNPDFLNEENI